MGAEGSVYRRKDGRWVAQYRDAKGKVRYLYRKSKQEARKALREALRDRDEGYIPPSKITVGLYLDKWLDERRQTISPRTWKVQESLLRCHVTPHIGSQWLSTLSGKDVHGLYRILPLSPSTMGQLHALLKQALRDAVRAKYIRTNPTEHVKPPPATHKELDVLTASQLKRLLETVRGHRFEGVFVLGACCALRIGEALAIRTEDVDFTDGTLQVRRTLWLGNTYQPKTNSSKRTITLPAVALVSLRRHAENVQDGYLFTTSAGNPVDASNFYTWCWKPMLRRARLPESLTFHKLRHGAASLLLSEGVSVPVVSNYLGHANPSITMKVYAHLIDGTSHIAAATMDSLLDDGEHKRHLRAL